MLFSKKFEPNLRSLLIEQKWLTPEELQVLTQQISETQSLENLLLDQGILSQKDLAQLYQAIHSVQNPTKIFSLTENPATSSENFTKNATLFGKYQILQKIAQGGMGVVYLVRHKKLKQNYALKVIRDTEKADPENIIRFQREAKNAAKLKHPGIVQVYDFGVENGQYYLCMEYVEGETLEQWLQKKHPLRQKIEVMQKVLEILHFAHEQEIIHRDLKPSNIFLDQKGSPKIGDFGLSKDISHTQKSQQLTQSGEVIGTPSYMPPEQVSGDIHALDRTSDIYAIGACLYQAITAHCPFEGNTVHELFYKIVSEDPLPPSHWNNRIQRDLDVIILKALNKLKKKRYATAKDFAEDLGRFLKGYPIQARPLTSLEKIKKWFKRNNQLSIVMFTAMIGIFLFLGGQYWSTKRERKNKFEQHYLVAQNLRQKFEAQTLAKKEQMNTGLDVLNELNRALSFYALPEAERQKKKLGGALISICSQLEEFALAKYLIQDLKPLISIEQFQDYEKTIITQQQELLTQHKKKLEQWIQKFQEGKIAPGERETALFEITQMSEPKIYSHLEEILEESVTYYSQPEKRTSLKDLFYETFVEILGRFEHRNSAAKLYSILEKMLRLENSKIALQFYEMQNYLIVLAQALGNTRNYEYFERFQTLRKKVQDTPFFYATERSLLKLKNPNQWVFSKENRK